MTKAYFDVYLNTAKFAQSRVAECVIEEIEYRVTRVGFRYGTDYLAHPDAFSLDPVALPLTAAEFEFKCEGGIPGFLDDYLPDDWGKKVLAQWVLYQKHQGVNANSVIQVLQQLGDSRIGALMIVPKGHSVHFSLGCDYRQLVQAEHIAGLLDVNELSKIQLDQMSLVYLVNSGTGVGGARPKALVYKQNQAYLAKFNRLTQDSYNNARVELACLKMAEQAGLEVCSGQIVEGVNGRELLLLERFDVMGSGSRHHLVSLNALLKDSATQRDSGHVFSYEKIAGVIRRESYQVSTDLQQLLALMLFNRGIHNTDDHERNVSMLHDGIGFRLAPAYDLVPSVVAGQYHAAGFNYQPYPPKSSEVAHMGRIFDLPKIKIQCVAEQVAYALKQWPTIAASVGVSSVDINKVLQQMAV